jgi:hypothetical protein
MGNRKPTACTDITMKFMLFGILALASAFAPTAALAMPVQYVRICPDQGPSFFYLPGTTTCVNVQDDNNKALEGTAIGLAIPSPQVDSGHNYAIGGNVGTFQGQTAIGIGAAVKANDNLTFSAGAGYGLGQGTIGGKAGFNLSW